MSSRRWLKAMQMVVLNVACPFLPVGLNAADNSSQTLAQLDAALVHGGHESIVMACEGSATQGILLATPKASESLDEQARNVSYAQYRFTLDKFIERWPVDLMHFHGADFYSYLPSPGIPVLITLHSPVSRYPETIFQMERPQTFLRCVSAEQRDSCPPCPYLLPETETGAEHYFAVYERLIAQARAAEAASNAKEIFFAG